MAGKYYQLILSNLTDQIQQYLTSYYGAGVTVHFKNTEYIIFSCPAISNKIIKIRYYRFVAGADTYDALNGSFGDLWTSATTITNEKMFMGWTNGSSYNTKQYLFSGMDLILYNNYLILSANGSIKQMIMLGALTNGKYAALGLSGNVQGGVHGYLTDFIAGDGDIELLSMNPNQVRDSGKFIIHPILMSKRGEIIKNTDGTYATITSLYNVMHSTYMAGSTFFISSTGYYNASGVMQLATGLFCETTA